MSRVPRDSISTRTHYPCRSFSWRNSDFRDLLSLSAFREYLFRIPVLTVSLLFVDPSLLGAIIHDATRGIRSFRTAIPHACYYYLALCKPRSYSVSVTCFCTLTSFLTALSSSLAAFAAYPPHPGSLVVLSPPGGKDKPVGGVMIARFDSPQTIPSSTVQSPWCYFILRLALETCCSAAPPEAASEGPRPLGSQSAQV